MSNETKERPIIFSGPMVRAILTDQKTQTRRILKDTTEHKGPYNPAYLEVHRKDKGWAQICPHGKPGDHLWVRETWCNTLEVGGLINQALKPKVGSVEYAADMGIERFPLGGNFTPKMHDFKWIPSIHMPRWACRIVLEITGVRVERLNDISEDDAKAEGIWAEWQECDSRPSLSGNAFYWGDKASRNGGFDKASQCFEALWSTIHASDGPNGWASNKWVWVIEFKRVKP